MNYVRRQFNRLYVHGESDFAPGAFMTTSVDGPVAGTDPFIVPFLIDQELVYFGWGRYRLRYDLSGVPESCSVINKRRLSIQTDEGGAYNDKVR